MSRNHQFFVANGRIFLFPRTVHSRIVAVPSADTFGDSGEPDRRPALPLSVGCRRFASPALRSIFGSILAALPGVVPALPSPVASLEVL